MDEGKVHPIASNSGEKLGAIAMPANVIRDADGSSRVILSEPTGCTAEVLLHGGQIVSWKNERREELLFLTNKALWKAGKVIKGGISICFPQCINFGSPEQPGFVRNRLWSVDDSPAPLPPANSRSTVDLLLKSTDDDLKNWPHRLVVIRMAIIPITVVFNTFLCCFGFDGLFRFELRLRISVTAGKLTVIPRVRNVDSKPFSFAVALCSYLSVSDISEVRVEGLETLDYFDNLLQRERYTEQADAITFDGEVERVYLSTPPKIAVIDHEKKRTYVLRKDGMPDAALWNPWDKKAKAMPDFGDEDYRISLCIDSSSIETPIVLKPCEEWKGRQELTAVSSSYCSGQLDPRKVLQGYQY
ncbi:putative glucose-6-phosphate 1-epimerase isoform X1 [Salvia splendens]|uniref:putative glucose-6-phosphate 1-epimerase isoform X1 n=1 Tax=Salvia splendens TaxID=180675 RepID=UPI001C272477|nr:putative glucose-6-phosphate 1-epimerase isoform X1 [Salvia splendens]